MESVIEANKAVIRPSTGTAIRRHLHSGLKLAAFVITTFAAVAAIAASGGVAHALAPAKPTPKDFDRVQLAAQAAGAKMGLVDHRRCSYSNLRCINAATNTEASAFGRAVLVQRAVARTLGTGRCKTALLNRANGYAKKRANVLNAQRYWNRRQVGKASSLYYAEWNPGARLDGLFLIHCG